MTSITARRVAKLEDSLQPREAVLAWLAEAQQFPTFQALAQSIADQPVEAAPLTVIGARVEAATRESMKGRSRDEVGRAVHEAVGDAVFLYCLVIVLNVDAFEVARLEGLRAAATFFWMGCLLGGPHEPPAPDEHARQDREAWSQWRSVVDALTFDARGHAEARTELEARYFGGRDVLLPDAATAWAGHVDLVQRLVRMADLIGSIQPTRPARRTRAQPQQSHVGVRASALTMRLADDARVKAYEILGERERAVSIMERRLRAPVHASPNVPQSIS